MKNLPGLLLVILSLTGCEDRQIKIYTVPKEIAQTSGQNPAIDRPHWIVPPEWKELPPSGMRAAFFTVSGGDGKAPIDISVVTFPGQAGGLLANLNRWRGQMKLTPASEAGGLETLDAGGQPVQIVELTSATGDQAMLGAIFLREDQSWFLKLTGDAAEIAKERARFRQFAQSFRFQSSDNPAAPRSTNDG